MLGGEKRAIYPVQSTWDWQRKAWMNPHVQTISMCDSLGTFTNSPDCPQPWETSWPALPIPSAIPENTWKCGRTDCPRVPGSLEQELLQILAAVRTNTEQSLKEYETRSTCEHNPEQNWARNDISVMRSYIQLVFLMLFLLPFLDFYFSPVPFGLPSSSWVHEAEKESSHTVAQDFLGKPFHLWHNILNT